jgi:hypothetical protein
MDELWDGLLLALRSALVEEGLESSLEVEGHCAETCAFEEEIKFHILLRLQLGGVDNFCFLVAVGPFFFLAFYGSFLNSYGIYFLFGWGCCFRKGLSLLRRFAYSFTQLDSHLVFSKRRRRHFKLADFFFVGDSILNLAKHLLKLGTRFSLLWREWWFNVLIVAELWVGHWGQGWCCVTIMRVVKFAVIFYDAEIVFCGLYKCRRR